MLSYACGKADVPLFGETIGAAFARVAARCPDRDVVVSVHQNARMTYRELDAATDELARGLIGLGVKHGDRVGIWATNSLEWAIAQFATPKIGAILVNVNPSYRTSEVAYALRQSGVSVLLTQVRHKTSEYAQMLAEIRDGLPELRHVVLIGDDELDAPLEAMRLSDVMTLAAAGVSAEKLAERGARAQFDEASTPRARPAFPKARP